MDSSQYDLQLNNQNSRKSTKSISQRKATLNTIVYSWGSNAYGQLGHAPGGSPAAAQNGAPHNRLTPTLIHNLPKNIVQLDSFNAATFALTSTGQVYAFGRNWKGSLGMEEERSEVPKQVPGLQNIM